MEKSQEKDIKIYKHIKPEEIELLNNEKGIRKVRLVFWPDYPKKKWFPITNKEIKVCSMYGDSGKYDGLTPPLNVEELFLKGTLTNWVNDGLYYLKSLKKITSMAYYKTKVSPLLNHPSLEEIVLSGVKEDVVVIDNPKIRKFHVDTCKINELYIKNNNLEELRVLSKNIHKVDIDRNLNSLKSLSIEGKNINVYELLDKSPNIETLELYNYKEINMVNIKKLRNLKSLTLFNVKKVFGEESSFDLNLEELRVHFTKYELIKSLLDSDKLKHLKLYDLKKFDVNDLKDPTLLESLRVRGLKVENINLLRKSTKLKLLLLLELVNNKPDFSFLSSLNNLENLNVPYDEEQHDFLTEYFSKRKNCLCLLNRYSAEDYLEINEIGNYKNIGILEYDDKGKNKLTYGIFDNIGDMLNCYNNSEAEELIIKHIRGKREGRKFEFDSEADNFSVTTKNLDDLKWLIDKIYELIN